MRAMEPEFLPDAGNNGVVREEAIPIPPLSHPRLFVNKDFLVELRKRTTDPTLSCHWRKIVDTSKEVVSEQNLQQKLKIMESCGFIYLIENDEEAGRKAVELTLSVLASADFDLSILDISRLIGKTMITSAQVYDWCYPLLSDGQKDVIIKHLERLAVMLECGYPPTKQSSITSHTGEAMLMRDMLGTGIAIYNEKPDMYMLAAQRFFGEMVPARNFMYTSHMHHQGDSYGATRYHWEIYASWLFKRMSGIDVFTSHQGQVPYRWIYTRRPDGQMLVDGDTHEGSGTNIREPIMMTASYYNDPFLQAEFLKYFDIRDVDPVTALLFYDPNLKPEPTDKLPLTRFFGYPMGSMIARTGWETGAGAPAAVAEMKVVVYNFLNHQHLDSGSFQIYYKGPLAIDSGAYRIYGTPHDFNYYKRTIAHNSMLVYNPDEKIETCWKDRGTHNDGGQRWPNYGMEPRDLEVLLTKGYKVGEVIGHQIGPDTINPDYSYLKGDLTAAYSDKVSEYYRSFVFLNMRDSEHPAVLVVFDRVVSSNAAYKKYWLLHCIDEPEIEGNVSIITQVDSKRGYSGKLVNHALLPERDNIGIAKTGGEGKDAWVFGTNFPHLDKLRPHDQPGAWRIEISPGKEAREDIFLNVMQVMDSKSCQPLMPKKLDLGSMTGTIVGDRIVLFSKTGQRLKDDFSISVNVPGQNFKYVITDMEEGYWKVVGKDKEFLVEVTHAGGVLYFEGSGQNYEFRRLSGH